jgi:hypothetical protein
VLPSVFGLTCARSRNSATPSSGERSSWEYTSGSTTCSPMGAKPRREKKSTSNVRQNSRDRRALRAPRGARRPRRRHRGAARHRDDEGADLAQVLPHDVQRAAADEFAVGFGDDELLHRLVHGDDVLAEQDPPLHPRLEKTEDAAHVGGARGADGEGGHGPTVLADARTCVASRPLRWSRAGDFRGRHGSAAVLPRRRRVCCATTRHPCRSRRWRSRRR